MVAAQQAFPSRDHRERYGRFGEKVIETQCSNI
jgi:hypothetical protein